MRNEDLLSLSDKILPNLIKFASIIAPDQLLSEQVVVDAITVFYLENKDYLIEEDFDPKDREQRKSMTKYVKEQLIQEVYLLMEKKSFIKQGSSEFASPEYEEFCKLNVKEKTVMYLREIENLSLGKIQGLLGIKFYDLIQIFYNAKDKLLRGPSSEQELNKLSEKGAYTRNFHLVSSYVYGTCPEEQRDRVERLLAQDKAMKDYFLLKQNERDFLRQLIPDTSPSKATMLELRREVISVINQMIPSKEKGFVNKVKRALNKPIITLEI